MNDYFSKLQLLTAEKFDSINEETFSKAILILTKKISCNYFFNTV